MRIWTRTKFEILLVWSGSDAFFNKGHSEEESNLPIVVVGELGGTAHGVGESSGLLLPSSEILIGSLITNLGVVIVELLPGGGLFSLSDQKTCYDTTVT